MGACIIFAIIFGLYLKNVMTVILYEYILQLFCVLSLIAVSYAVIEDIATRYFHIGDDVSRFSAMFFYPNYYGTIIGTVIIICAYKILTNREQKFFYYMVTAANAVGMYLCKSIFVWVEVYIGVAVLLLIVRKYRLLALWIGGALLAAFLIFVLNVPIIPRLSEAGTTTMLRVQIWETAIEGIKSSPLIGHGFMSYLFLNKDYYDGRIIPHAHSLYLDMFINIGAIGTVLIMSYFLDYYKKVLRVCFKEKKTRITALILAVTVAALVHGLVDITLFWIQTLPLFIIILSGLGAYENNNFKVYY